MILLIHLLMNSGFVECASWDFFLRLFRNYVYHHFIFPKLKVMCPCKYSSVYTLSKYADKMLTKWWRRASKSALWLVEFNWSHENSILAHLSAKFIVKMAASRAAAKRISMSLGTEREHTRELLKKFYKMRDALAFSENILLLEWLLEFGDAKLSDEQRQAEIITNNGPGPGPRPSRGRKRPRMKSQTLIKGRLE